MREYFSHDYNARNDQKIVSLRRNYGVEGVGIYWCLVEIMYECYGSIHIDKIDDIAFDLRVDKDKISNILNGELFKKKGKKYISNSILKRLEQRQEKTDKTRQAALKSWESRRKPDADAMHGESDCNAIKGKDIKENIKDIKEGKKPDFIGKILDQFCEAYLTATGNEYSILAPGKERAAIGKLLKLYKEKYPGAKSEDTLTSLRVYFDAVVVIPDNWLRENMSPSIIISKFNEINNILKNGKNRGNSKGATDRELAEIIVKHFGNE